MSYLDPCNIAVCQLVSYCNRLLVSLACYYWISGNPHVSVAFHFQVLPMVDNLACVILPSLAYNGVSDFYNDLSPPKPPKLIACKNR